jgi:hypothetical protein
LQAKKTEDETIVLPTKSTLSIKDIPGDVTREDIKSAILAVCESAKIAFIDFDKGSVEATIRLSEQDSAATVRTPLIIKMISAGSCWPKVFSLNYSNFHRLKQWIFLPNMAILWLHL